MCKFNCTIQDSLYFVSTVCGLSVTSAKSIISSQSRHNSASSQCVFSVSVHLRRGSLFCTPPHPQKNQKKPLNQLWSHPTAPGSKWALIHKKPQKGTEECLAHSGPFTWGLDWEELNFTQPFTPPAPCEHVHGGLGWVCTHGHANTLQQACMQRFNPFHLPLQGDFATMARKPNYTRFECWLAVKERSEGGHLLSWRTLFPPYLPFFVSLSERASQREPTCNVIQETVCLKYPCMNMELLWEPKLEVISILCAYKHTL